MKSFKQYLNEDKPPLDKPTPSFKQIQKKFHISPRKLLLQIKQGIKVEKEHTSNNKVAYEIARDHLGELPNYYTKLKKMEK